MKCIVVGMGQGTKVLLIEEGAGCGEAVMLGGTQIEI